MSPQTIPLETIEHTLDFLRDDLRALAKCALVCRALLPTCRTHLYRDISLTHEVVDGKTVETSRTKRFFQLVDADPDILLYVRALTLDYGQDIFQSPPMGARDAGRAWKYVLRRCFPSLRSLTLCYLTMSGLADLTAAITHFLPELESLSFRDLQVLEGPTDIGVPLSLITPWSTDEWVARGGAARSNLRAFSLVDLYNEVAALSKLVSLLGHYPQLDSLDIRPQMPLVDDLLSDPRHIISEFAPRLRHFGLLLRDITGDGAIPPEERERMERVLADLPQCRELRSLCVHYSCFSYYLSTMMAANPMLMPGEPPRPATPPQLSPFFLDTLCDVLSSTPGAPFPLLEELAIVLHNPLTWLGSWADGLDRLATLLVGERFPRFRRLEICASISALTRILYTDKGLEEARLQIREVKEGFLRPILKRFEEAGVEVDIKVT
ncbi:hypothetical protein FKP32DRAFT_657338 [Trametes sanguinea]|nr:hypothetical protein FKP32DRAFT_657338 [Trametes sanguinea]